MSGRSAIYDAMVTALTAATTAVSYVTRDLEPWWDWGPDKFPAVRVIDQTEAKGPLAYPDATAQDMEGMVEFGVSGYVRDTATSTGLADKRTALISDIESVIMSSAGVSAVVADIWPVAVETDEGTIENFAWCEVTFRARYFYNHGTP